MIIGPRAVFVGLLTLDVVHRVGRQPGPDEKLTASDQALAAGGPATNAAATFAALGGHPTLLTAVGRHPLARAAAAEAESCGVRVIDVTTHREVPPAVSAIRVGPDGSRSVSSPNASGLLAVDTTTVEVINGDTDVVLCDGHLPELAVAAAVRAHTEGIPVLLDCGSPKPVFDALLPLTSFAIASADYGRDAATRFVTDGVPAAAQTRGGRSVLWATADGDGEVPVPRTEARDTLGAGDAFHGAAAYAIGAVGGPTALAAWTRVLELAVAVAGVRVQHAGPRAWLADPQLAELAAPWLA